MDFVDDLPDDTADARYERHARFLRTLKEDTLLIVDNFNATADEDALLAKVMAYRCKVLFTPRCRFDEYPTLELGEISDKQTLLHFMGYFYSEAEQHQETLLCIIDAVHSHTLALELAARLLETGMLKPHALLAKLQAEKAAFADSDTINIHKDGHSTQATYYRHIHTLFSLYRLATADQNVMRSLCFTPPNGISARLLAKWLWQDDLNIVNGLIELGFVQSQPGRIIALHPLVQEIALEELKPSTQNSRGLLDCLHEICLRHGEETPHVQAVMQTIEGIVTHAIKDNPAYYLRFIEDAILFAEKYRCQRGVVALVHEMEALLADSTLGALNDRALLLSYQAMCANSPVAALRLQEQALTLLTGITADNVLLASNIHANLGGMYGNVKTANPITPTGVKAYPTKPIFGGDILEYAGTYYLIGEGHKEFIADKSMDEDYYILTLMAVARELSLAGLTRADVHLVVGLPMIWVRTQRESFRAYLMRKTDLQYRYGGKEYRIHLER